MRVGGVDVAVGGVAGEWVVAGGVLPVGRALLSDSSGVATAVGADVVGSVASVFGAAMMSALVGLAVVRVSLAPVDFAAHGCANVAGAGCAGATVWGWMV